jgi:signal transduction histidine kinase
MSTQRPVTRWFLFTLCVGLFIAALGWLTVRMLQMEKQNVAAANDAQVQEKMRLALWRMDSLINTLLVRENSRPPQHYSAFYSPTDLFSNLSKTELPTGSALTPSPLLGDVPEFINLHFEIVSQPSGTMCVSPQVPTGEGLTLSTAWYAVTPQIKLAKGKLSSLNELLRQHPLPGARTSPPSEPKPAAASVPAPEGTGSLSASPQIALNAVEFNQRRKVSTSNVKDMLLEKAPQRRAASPAPASAPAAAALTQQAAEPAAKIPPPSDFRSQWLGDQLILTRNATLSGLTRVQGIWLDWIALKSSLVATIQDLLPNAQLLPLAALGQDASSLVSLPVRLLPGQVDVIANASSPLMNSLILAWACFAAAALAVALLLHRAIQLSERRGAFVSAVTHELRTPLTTFQLYSEMLAEDMIPDAVKRREYLQTLCDESSRLTHLVENVLSYSRIERGRAAARKERVKLGDLMARLEPRLKQRTAQCDLALQLTITEEAKSALLELDALGVEQIIFNLIDNACKYAAPVSANKSVQITIGVEGSRAFIQVRDFGHGISAPQLKKLFKPFEKSATEAAHSAPGVGLGLALSRRLARELGGDLTLTSNEAGATFQLTLPLSTPKAKSITPS